MTTGDGITVRTGRSGRKIDHFPNGLGCTLHLRDPAPVAAGRLLVAAGRTPVTEGMGLENAGGGPRARPGLVSA